MKSLRVPFSHFQTFFLMHLNFSSLINSLFRINLLIPVRHTHTHKCPSQNKLKSRIPIKSHNNSTFSGSKNKGLSRMMKTAEGWRQKEHLLMNSWDAWGPCAPQQGGPGSPCSTAESGEHLAGAQSLTELIRVGHSQPCSLLRSMHRCWTEGQVPKLSDCSSWASHQQRTSRDPTGKHRWTPHTQCKRLARGLVTKSTFDWANLQALEKQGNNLAGEHTWGRKEPRRLPQKHLKPHWFY